MMARRTYNPEKCAEKGDTMSGRYWATFERISATRGIVTLTDASKGGEWAGAHNVEVKNPAKGLADAAYDSARTAAASKGGVLDRFTEV